MSAAILAYHSLDDSGSVISTSPALFAQHMRELRESGRRVVSLDELPTAAAAESVVAITFDDGFRSIHEHALPLLSRHGFPATVFLVTDYVGRANDWPTQPSGIPTWPLLNWAHVREMSESGISFASHTRTHPNLTRLSPGEVEEELTFSKRRIEDALGSPADCFAYPYGACSGAVRATVARHFRLACSTVLGYADAGSDVLSLERLDAWYLRRPGMISSLFGRRVRAYVGARRLGRALRARLVAPLEPDTNRPAAERRAWDGTEGAESA